MASSVDSIANHAAPDVVRIVPTGGMDILSQHEVARLRETGQSGLHDLFRSGMLPVYPRSCSLHHKAQKRV